MSQAVPAILTEQSVRKLGGVVDVYPASLATLQGTVLLIVSRGGGGKTTTAATVGDSEFVPKDQKQLFIDIEGNMHVIKHRTDCEFAPINSWPRFEAIAEAGVAGELQGYYHTLHVDNISELIDLKIREVFGEDRLNIDENVSWPQWNRVTRDVLAKIRDLKNMSRRYGINVVFTAWDMPDPKKPYYATLQANPALRDKIPGILSFIGYIETDEKDQSRELHFEFSAKHISKWQCAPGDAAASVPMTFKIDIAHGPHLGTVMDVIRGDRKWPFQTTK